jgi:hypothetical protein
MLSKRTTLGPITVLPDGQLQVRDDTIIDDDGVEVSRTYHRRVLDPADAPDLTAAPEALRALAAAVWTPAIIAARKAAKAATTSFS